MKIRPPVGWQLHTQPERPTRKKYFAPMYFFCPSETPLRRRKGRMHFSPETALNLIERTTSEAERRFWDKHIESCSECVVELCEWSTLVGWVTRMHLVSAPAD